MLNSLSLIHRRFNLILLLLLVFVLFGLSVGDYNHSENTNGNNECRITLLGYTNNIVSELDGSSEQILYESVYATFIGGSGIDESQSIALDSEGNIYIAGSTDSSDFLGLSNESYEIKGRVDCFVLKLNPSGTEMIYATVIGGIGADEASSIYVDSDGCVYVTGRTSSFDFPTKNAFNDTHSGAGDCFVLKLNPEGNELLYSTFIGGSDNEFANDIAVDSEGCAYVTGSTFSENGQDFDFPLVNPYDDTWNGENEDAFVFKLSADGNSLVYSTIIGGFAGDWLDSIAVDSAGNAIVTGNTESEDWPMINAFDPIWSSGVMNVPDIVLFKLNASGNGMLWSTYIGGNGSDYGRSIALDSSDDIYLVGATNSHDFPIVNPIQSSFNGGWSDCFILKMTSDGQSLIYSSFLGGDEYDEARDIALDVSGNVYISGYSTSTNFPVVNSIDSENNGKHDCIVFKLNPEGSSLLFSTYYGGSENERAYSMAVDNGDSIYITGKTRSSDFPTINEYQHAYNGGDNDCFILKLEANSNNEMQLIAMIVIISCILGITIVIGVIIKLKKAR